jgi:hypothetical protein
MHAHTTAGSLQLLVEHMKIADWRTDEFDHDDLERVTDSLRGMAMRAAMHAGDPGTLSTITGRRAREIKPFDDGDQQ